MEALADHVHVRLKDYARLVLHAGSSRLADDDIARLIDNSGQAELFAYATKVRNHLLFMFRLAGNAVDFRKLVKDTTCRRTTLNIRNVRTDCRI